MVAAAGDHDCVKGTVVRSVGFGVLGYLTHAVVVAALSTEPTDHRRYVLRIHNVWSEAACYESDYRSAQRRLSISLLF